MKLVQRNNTTKATQMLSLVLRITMFKSSTVTYSFQLSSDVTDTASVSEN
jgi:hypothetical protein